MNKILSMILASLSCMAFAKDDCASAAKEVAKLNLDSKARAYSFEYSDIPEAASKVVRDEKRDSQTYFYDGYIYKAYYEVAVEVDSSCGVKTVKIRGEEEF